ncbi:MAG: hypothetical protein AAF391_13455 [Bacteroidota bacterium]
MKKLLIYITVALLLFACDDSGGGDCRTKAVITNDFETASSEQFNIVSASVDGSFLEIEISSGGCDGESWCAELLVSTLVAESYPPQVGIRVVLENDEECDAVVNRTFSYDLKPLDEISDIMILHLQGWDEPLQYPGYEVTDLAGKWYLMNINGGLTGINNQFNQGEISWSFSNSEVTIVNSTTNPDKYSSLESGTYPFEMIGTGIGGTKILQVDGQDLGVIVQLTSNSLVVDQRAVDGFQYVFMKDE